MQAGGGGILLPGKSGLAGGAVVGAMADDDGPHGAADRVGEPFPGLGDIRDDAARLLMPAAAGLAGDAVEQAPIGHRDHDRVDGVVAMIPAVLRLAGAGQIMVRQMVVEAPGAAQHLGEAAGRNPDMRRALALLRIKRREIFPCQPREMLRVGEVPGEEAALRVEAMDGVRLETPALLLRQPGSAAGDGLPVGIGPEMGAQIGPRLPGRALALDAIDLAQAEDAVSAGIVERHAERQDVIDLDGAREQHVHRDLAAGIDAAPVEHVLAVELLPEFQERAVAALVGLAEFPELLRALFGRVAVLAILRVDLALALLVELELAGELDRDLDGWAVAADQAVDHAAQLIEADMHGRVGQPADAQHIVLLVGIGGAGEDVPFQDGAIVRQGGMPLLVLPDLPVAEIGMVAEPGRLHRLAIDDDLVLQRLDQRPRRRLAEAAIAFGQVRAGDGLRLFARQGMALAQPGLEIGRLLVAFDPAQAIDRLPLRLRRKTEPDLAEALRMGHLGGNLVALHVLAVLALLVEAGVGIELQRLAQGGIGDRPLARELGEQGVALRLVEGACLGAGEHDPQRIDLLEQAPALEERMRLGQARLGRQQRAVADLRLLQRPLMEDDLVELLFALGRQRLGVMCRLRLPDRLELVFEHAAVGVEVIDVACPAVLGIDHDDTGAHMRNRVGIAGCGAAPMQELAERLGIGRPHLLVKSGDADPDLAAVVVIAAAIGLAVGFEAAALVEMEERPPDMGKRQRLTERLRAQRVGIERGELLTRLLVGREEAGKRQVFDEGGLTLPEAITPAPHGAGVATGPGERGARFRLAPIGEDARAGSDDAPRCPDSIDDRNFNYGPANRISAKISAETPVHTDPHQHDRFRTRLMDRHPLHKGDQGAPLHKAFLTIDLAPPWQQGGAD